MSDGTINKDPASPELERGAWPVVARKQRGRSGDYTAYQGTLEPSSYQWEKLEIGAVRAKPGSINALVVAHDMAGVGVEDATKMRIIERFRAERGDKPVALARKHASTSGRRRPRFPTSTLASIGSGR